MKSLGMAVAAMAAVVGLVGCGSETETAGSAPGTARVTSTAGPGGEAMTPERPASASPTSEWYHSPQVSAPAEPVTTTLPTRDDATVDARDYQIGDKFHFQSPSGNIKCGFINDSTFGTGCQLKDAKVIPAELRPGCDNSSTRKVAAYVTGSTAKFICLNQGVFVGISPNPGGNGGLQEGGGKVLNYGETIIVKGTACTSLPTGVRCDQGGHGFFIAGDQQSLF
ncbi:hypothetical protein [Nocardia sp. XZ_19_385]|uniref:hypothetical protein n=1 Tax=Nocardia sp. XZ_19_385 TaxID=2769488 RepID=UPI001E3BC967|nr:hypothetical protein [Nocardia sp. XZ_19_385]